MQNRWRIIICSMLLIFFSGQLAHADHLFDIHADKNQCYTCQTHSGGVLNTHSGFEFFTFNSGYYLAPKFPCSVYSCSKDFSRQLRAPPV